MSDRKQGWKAKLLLGLIKLISVIIVAWYAVPAIEATFDYFKQTGKKELASVGSINVVTVQLLMKHPENYNWGELKDAVNGEAPQYPRWPFIAQQKANELIAQVDKMALEFRYDPYSESFTFQDDVTAWKADLLAKIDAYKVKGEQKFGKEQMAKIGAEYDQEQYKPRFDWSPVYGILGLFWNALVALLIGRFIYFMTKAGLEGYKLRFEWIPHRAPLAALLVGVDYFVDFYPSGSPSGQVKAMLGWTFSTVFSGLILMGAAGSAGAQTSGATKKAKDKDPYSLQIDVRDGESFGDKPNPQKQLRTTLLGRNSQPWLIENVIAESPTAFTETFTPGYAFKRRPYTFNVLGGFRATISRRPTVKSSYSALACVQYFYRKPGKFAVYVPSLSLEFQLRPVKRTIFNFNSAVLKEVKKFDYGADITVRKPFDQSNQWTIGGVVGYRPSKKWPRFEFGVFRNWLNETRWRLRMTQQFTL